MKLFVVMAQRAESYRGEYAPEALAVQDEYGHDNYPEYLNEKLTKAKTCGEFENAVLLTLQVDASQIMAMLRPGLNVLPAKICD